MAQARLRANVRRRGDLFFKLEEELSKLSFEQITGLNIPDELLVTALTIHRESYNPKEKINIQLKKLF